MGNKEDWEEVEKNVKESENRRLASHKGTDYSDMLEKINQKPKEKTISKATKKIFKLAIIIFCTIAIIIMIIIAKDYMYQLRHSHNVNVKDDIERRK